MDAETMKELQKTEIELLDYVVQVCEENNLQYFLIAGTLLGAIRHRGFIPWDDDIDIGLLRKDFNTLCSILEKNVNNKQTPYYFQQPCVNNDFKLPFVKIRKRNTVFLEDQELDQNREQGIFIDIFPYDNAINSKSLMKVFRYIVYRLLGKSKKKDDLAYRFAKLLATAFENINTKNVILYGCKDDIQLAIQSKHWFSVMIDVEFEGKKYKAPKEYKDYLSHCYGDDYMELPPIEKRISHEPKMIVFDKKTLIKEG